MAVPVWFCFSLHGILESGGGVFLYQSSGVCLGLMLCLSPVPVSQGNLQIHQVHVGQDGQVRTLHFLR